MSKQHIIDLGTVQADQLSREGWRPCELPFDPSYFWQKVTSQPELIGEKFVSALTSGLELLFNKDYHPVINLVRAMGDKELSEKVNEMKSLVCLKPPTPSSADYPLQLSYKTQLQDDTFDSKVEEGFELLRKAAFDSALETLGIPDKIYQLFDDVTYELSPKLFTGWSQITRIGSLRAYFEKVDAWLVIQTDGEYVSLGADYLIHLLMFRKESGLMMDNFAAGKAVTVRGKRAQLVQVSHLYKLEDYTPDVQKFTNQLFKHVENDLHTGCLAYGEPGTGKTQWTYLVASRLIEQGFAVMEFDAGSFSDIYLDGTIAKLCFIVQEADDIANNREESENGRSRAEKVLSVLDSTNLECLQVKGTRLEKIVFLFTSNSKDRLDKAFLRKGRIDLAHQFSHRYAAPTDYSSAPEKEQSS